MGGQGKCFFSNAAAGKNLVGRKMWLLPGDGPIVAIDSQKVKMGQTSGDAVRLSVAFFKIWNLPLECRGEGWQSWRGRWGVPSRSFGSGGVEHEK
jgi:hypothetical protein